MFICIKCIISNVFFVENSNFPPLYTPKAKRMRAILHIKDSEKKNWNRKKGIAKKRKMCESKCRCSCSYEIHENYVFSAFYIVTHSYRLKIFNTWEYSYIRHEFEFTPLIWFPPPNMSVVSSRGVSTCILYYSTWKIYGIFLIYLCLYVFQYTIFTRQKRK